MRNNDWTEVRRKIRKIKINGTNVLRSGGDERNESIRGSYRTKEDDVAKIFTSIFVTNFPESFSAKDLFHSCKQYGHVVDTFIPRKWSKARKRFGFVRFINVFNDEMLRNLVNVSKPVPNPGVGKSVNGDGEDKMYGFNVVRNSYVHVLKGHSQLGSRNDVSNPTLVLDDDCLASKDMSKALFGRVKEFASLANLKMALCNEGFLDIKIQYLGELWVMLDFVFESSLKSFRDNVSVGSWFLQIKQASMEFMTEGRIAWVEVEGILFKLWSGTTFKRVAAKWGQLLDIDDQEDECFHSKRLCIHTKNMRSINEDFKICLCGMVSWIHAKETPGWVPDFKIDSKDEEQDKEECNDGGSKNYDTGIGGNDSDVEEVPDTVFEEIRDTGNKKREKDIKKTNSENSLKYPPGFTPMDNNDENVVNMCNGEDGNNVSSGTCYCLNNKREVLESLCSGHFKKSEAPRTGGSILNVLDEVVKVRKVMGYKMDGCMANMADIIESQGAKGETKMDNMELFCVRRVWGNVNFEFVHSDSVGNSGGILCVWDPNSFCKRSATVLDYFIMVRGEWCLTGKEVLFVAIYAPHDFKEKHTLWDYLIHEIGKWNGEVVIMGDFNEEKMCDEVNTMKKLMGKLKHLKAKIREWNKANMVCMNKVRTKYKEDLATMDAIIYCGNENEEIVEKRMGIINDLQNVDKLHLIEMAQKAKIKWSIEGDENSRYFHGLINKKRSLLNIQGMLVEGRWIDNPKNVKMEFYKHFSERFGKPGNSRDTIQMRYPRTLSLDQQLELENEVVEAGMFNSIQLSSLVNISHMFYAEDAVFVGQWCDRNINTLMIKDAVRKLGCLTLTPFSYLGLTVGGSMSRFYTQSNSLWVRVIKAIHGDDGNIGANPKAGSKSCWMNIVHELNVLCNKGINLREHMSIKIGNGNNTRFWEDNWIGGTSLKLRYPRLYALENEKLISVGMKFSHHSLVSSFHRELRGGIEQVQLAFARMLIDGKTIPKVGSQTRWVRYVPIKVNVHAWKVKIDGLATRFNVSRRGIGVNSIMCGICDHGVETSDHLFFSCSMARQHLWAFRNRKLFDAKIPLKEVFYDE
nr:nucleotide-binding alpha-beta plait domain-containing protein [Tanacetum cinerariifolium]